MQRDPTIASAARIALPPIPYADLYCVIRPEGPARVPAYLGSTLRGGLAAALKRIACVVRRRPPCAQCDYAQACTYALLFETPRPRWAERLPKMETAPHPMLIEPPLGRNPGPSDEPIVFTVRLFGRAVSAAPFVIEAARRMAAAGIGRERCAFRLHEVRDGGADGPRMYGEHATTCTYSPTARMVGAGAVEARPAPSPDGIVIEFLTPTRLLQDGTLLNAPTLSAFVRAIVFRLKAISYFHGAGEWEPDFDALDEAQRRVEVVANDCNWRRLERYSSRQRKVVPLDGFVGRWSLRGAEGLETLGPLFAAGEVLHIGKGTVFGLGWYQIHPEIQS